MINLRTKQDFTDANAVFQRSQYRVGKQKQVKRYPKSCKPTGKVKMSTTASGLTSQAGYTRCKILGAHRL